MRSLKVLRRDCFDVFQKQPWHSLSLLLASSMSNYMDRDVCHSVTRRAARRATTRVALTELRRHAAARPRRRSSGSSTCSQLRPRARRFRNPIITCYNDFMARMRTASDSNVVAFVLRCKMKATYTQSAELQDDKAKADPTRARCFRNPTHVSHT